MNACDFNCFNHLKEELKEKRYSTFVELNNAITTAIADLNAKGTFNGVSKLPVVWSSTGHQQRQRLLINNQFSVNFCNFSF
jgi:hypothetical protein